MVHADKTIHLCNLTLEPDSLTGPDGCLPPIAKHNDTIRSCWYDTMMTDYELWVDETEMTNVFGQAPFVPKHQVLVAVPDKSCYSEAMRDVHLECTFEFPRFVDDLPNACSGIAGVMKDVEGINHLYVWIAFYSYAKQVGSEVKKVVQTQMVHKQSPSEVFVCSATYQVSGTCLGVLPRHAVAEPPPLPPNEIFPGVDVNGQQRVKEETANKMHEYDPVTWQRGFRSRSHGMT